ncbi:MAG TPA: hypothetical protein VGI22_23250 [Xanthobacteraceae bacterium]|jgi:nitrite reductase (NO-forming)
MREALRDIFRQWSILGGALCLILGGIFLASIDSPPSVSGAVAQAPTGAASPDAGGALAVAGRPAAASVAPVSNGPVVPTGNVGSQAPRAAPPLAADAPDSQAKMAEHAHVMVAQQAPEQQGGGQPAAATPALTVGASAAGGQVFRKCQACHSTEPGRRSMVL